MLTIKDILPLPKDRDGKPMHVKKPPERLRKEADDEWKTTPSSDEETESESEDDDIPEFDPGVPKDKEKKKEKQVKQKKVKQQHTYIGRKVNSGRMPGATSDVTKTTGAIYKRTPALGAVSNAYFHIKWDNGDAEEKYKYGQVRNGKNILKSLLGDI